jgi:hypothetical protein
MVCYAYVWDSTNSSEIFKVQKRAIGIITGNKNRDSCRVLFKNLKILPFYSHLLLFVVDNKSM